MRTASVLFSALLAASLVTGVTGCNDPTKDKSKAQTGEAVATASAAASAAPAAEHAAELKFDQSNSKITFVGSKVTGKHDGGFGTFKGTVNLVDGNPEKSSVTAEIDAASVTSDAEKLTEHLRSPDFFDAAKFAKVTFTSTGVTKGGDKGATHTITGNLDFHGVKKSISFPATVTVNGDKVDVTGEFSLNRKDFGVNYPGKQDDLIRDDVLVKLDIHAKK